MIRRHANWILEYLGPRLHRREMWRIVKINPAAAVITSWDTLPQDMRDWILDHEPELVVRYPQQVGTGTVLRYVRRFPKTALMHAAHCLPPEILAQLAVEHPDDALAYAANLLAPETFWTCVQRSGRWQSCPQLFRGASIAINAIITGGVTPTYYVIHARGRWHLFVSHRAMSPVGVATAREARQLAIEDIQSQVLVARPRILQFAAGDRPRFTEIVLSG
jgi:hypothetical protein